MNRDRWWSAAFLLVVGFWLGFGAGWVKFDTQPWEPGIDVTGCSEAWDDLWTCSVRVEGEK